MPLIMLLLEPQNKRQTTQRSSHTPRLPNTMFLLAPDSRRTARSSSVPAPCRRAAGTMVSFHVRRLFVRVLLLLAEAEDGCECVE